MREQPVFEMGWQATMARIPRGYRVNIVLYMLTALSLVALLGEVAFGSSDGEGGEFATATVPTTTTIPHVTTSTSPIVTTPLPPAPDVTAPSGLTATTSRFRPTVVVTQPGPEPEPEPEPEEPPVVTLPPTTEPEPSTVPPTTKKPPATTTTTSKKTTTTVKPTTTTDKKDKS
ncbi:MAG: hypothetical protein ACRD0Q_11725 [Acidimicrobiales bacterium]